MRRLVPWALVALVGVGAGLGAALGQRTRPARPVRPIWWEPPRNGVRRPGRDESRRDGAPGLSAASAPARTPTCAARPRGPAPSTSRPDTIRTSEMEHQIEWSSRTGGLIHAQAQTTSEGAIGIGSTLYQSLGPGGHVGQLDEDSPFRATRAHSGWASADGFALSCPRSTARSPRSASASSGRLVDGTPATRYLVRSEPRPVCPHPGSRQLPRRRSTTVWIDGKGRLVQARNSSTQQRQDPGGPPQGEPQFADHPSGSSTITSTLRFSAFGAPVHIAAPATAAPAASTSHAPLGTRRRAHGRGALRLTQRAPAALQIPVCSARTGSGSGTWGMKAFGGMVPDDPPRSPRVPGRFRPGCS